MQDDPFNLDRFVRAQSPVYATAVAELRSGRKRSHWMWFMFPQLQGLGTSEAAQRFAISSVEEAREYLAHPLLRSRIIECTRLVNDGTRAIGDIFEHPDDLKFHSSMTLFARVAGPKSEFAKAIGRFYSGKEDPRTCALLGDASHK